MADEALQAAIAEVLRERAAAGRPVTYRELARRAGVAAPQAIHRVTLALEAMARADHAAGRPLLAALAVSRAGGNIPGRGFFHLLAELGRYDGPDRGPEAARHHARELDAAIAHWGGGATGGDE